MCSASQSRNLKEWISNSATLKNYLSHPHILLQGESSAKSSQGMLCDHMGRRGEIKTASSHPANLGEIIKNPLYWLLGCVREIRIIFGLFQRSRNLCKRTCAWTQNLPWLWMDWEERALCTHWAPGTLLVCTGDYWDMASTPDPGTLQIPLSPNPNISRQLITLPSVPQFSLLQCLLSHTGMINDQNFTVQDKRES